MSVVTAGTQVGHKLRSEIGQANQIEIPSSLPAERIRAQRGSKLRRLDAPFRLIDNLGLLGFRANTLGFLGQGYFLRADRTYRAASNCRQTQTRTCLPFSLQEVSYYFFIKKSSNNGNFL
jgi:hypothetical protein